MTGAPMTRTVANIGCYSVVVVPIIGSVVSLLGTARGKSVLGIILGISEIKSLLRPFTGDVSGLTILIAVTHLSIAIDRDKK
jgi:hypothetical protein